MPDDGWPGGIEPVVPVPGYPNTWTHTPARMPFPRGLGATEMAAPVALARKLPCGEANLAEPVRGRPAIGQLMQVAGRILDEDGRPIAGAVVELWQANSAGRYAHPIDTSPAPLDPNFLGHGRALTDGDGRYAFFTVKPGAYAVPVQETWWRPPHLHFSVFGPSCLSRLVTQMYFPGDPLNEIDRILQSIPDAAARGRMVARMLPPASVGSGFLGFAHDIVLRGRHATPEA